MDLFKMYVRINTINSNKKTNFSILKWPTFLSLNNFFGQKSGLFSDNYLLNVICRYKDLQTDVKFNFTISPFGLEFWKLILKNKEDVFSNSDYSFVFKNGFLYVYQIDDDFMLKNNIFDTDFSEYIICNCDFHKNYDSIDKLIKSDDSLLLDSFCQNLPFVEHILILKMNLNAAQKLAQCIVQFST